MLPISKQIFSICLGESVEVKQHKIRRRREEKLKSVFDPDYEIDLNDDIWKDDDIEIKPLGAPTGILYYLDYTYKNKE